MLKTETHIVNCIGVKVRGDCPGWLRPVAGSNYCDFGLEAISVDVLHKALIRL